MNRSIYSTWIYSMLAALSGCGGSSHSALVTAPVHEAKASVSEEQIHVSSNAPVSPESQSIAHPAEVAPPMATVSSRRAGGAKADAAAKSAPIGATERAGQVLQVVPPGEYVADENYSGEDYRDYGINPATDPQKDRFSTFAIDVDTASYAIVRRKLTEGTMPPPIAVRAEEMVNFFNYKYESPDQGPFRVILDAAPSPYETGHTIMRVGIQGKRVSVEERKPVHLVYLVDTSGSMQSEDKIGLVKKSLRYLTKSLKPKDTVALCTYAGSVREVLAPTSIEKMNRVLSAIDDLSASGSTAMSSGIDLAYNLASRTLVAGDINRVVVLSDGDANVGKTSHEEILRTIQRHKDEGITLSTVGFGNGNYKDVMMEQLADKGDGNYSYIDNEEQAHRVFSEQVQGLLQVIAKDVKIQVEFDPSMVKSYRLIGYENRNVRDRDFRNDKVDGGEVGAGHNVTALYDVELKQEVSTPAMVRIRYKSPLGIAAQEMAVRLDSKKIYESFDQAPANFRLATSVVGFAEILRQSPYAKGWSLNRVESIARNLVVVENEQAELVNLIRRVRTLQGSAMPVAMAE